MNYIYICPICSHEHTVEVRTGKNTIHAIDNLPDECDECGADIDTEAVEEDIHATFEDQKEDYNED